MKAPRTHWSLGPQTHFKRDDGKKVWGWKIACVNGTAQLPKGELAHSNFAMSNCRFCLKAATEIFHQKICLANELLEHIPEKQERSKLRRSLTSLVERITAGDVDPEILERLRHS